MHKLFAFMIITSGVWWIIYVCTDELWILVGCFSWLLNIPMKCWTHNLIQKFCKITFTLYGIADFFIDNFIFQKELIQFLRGLIIKWIQAAKMHNIKYNTRWTHIEKNTPWGVYEFFIKFWITFSCGDVFVVRHLLRMK